MEKYECIVLTYNAPHRKTYDALCRLKALGYKDVLVWAVDFHYTKKFHPIYEHRPPVVVEVMPEKLCEYFGYDFIFSQNGYENFDFDSSVPVLVCGAGIIPESMVEKYRIINSHPGFIPLARGLDAFKWSLAEDIPIAATSHFLGSEIDAGEIIDQREVEVFENDTFHSLAQRLYDTEITLLVDALKKVNEKHRFVKGGENVIHKRMPAEIEEGILDAFETYKHKHAVED